ncbi:SWIM-type domain-containing protein [Trichonephila clavipes]|nr:SWIM-type domain-containing protein [Trichonephila clavipes]
MTHSIGSKPLLLKNFNLHEILNYSAKFSSATGNRSVAANVSKGLKLFDDKFVSKISFTEPDCLVNDDFFIQGFVKAKIKKRVTYKPCVQIRTTCQVISATCTCPAGGTPAFCKHVFALLHAINDYVAKKLYEAPTERLQTWHQPKPIKMVPQTSEELFMREPAITVENEIGFDFTAAPFFTSPLMEVFKNMQEIKLKETIPLPAFVSSGKIATDLPQMGLEEILYYHCHYFKSIDERTYSPGK